MVKWDGKVESVYIPPVRQSRRRWNPPWPLVALILAGWVAVMWWAGIVWAGR